MLMDSDRFGVNGACKPSQTVWYSPKWTNRNFEKKPGRGKKGMPVTILIADDHPLIREALTDTFSSQEDSYAVSVVGDGEALLSALSERPETALVLLDLYMPGPNGFELLSAIRQRFPDTRVVVLTASENPEDLKTAVRLGAAAYVLKSEPSHELVSVVRRVLQGRQSFPGDLSGAKDNTAAERTTRVNQDDTPLTERQTEVLRLIAEGCSNKEIARRLDLSENTVKIHVSAVFRALGVNNRTQAAVVARQKGVLLP